MIKDLWAKIAFGWFLFMLIFVGLFVPKKVFAATTIIPSNYNHILTYNILTADGYTTESSGTFQTSYTNFCPANRICTLVYDYYVVYLSNSLEVGRTYVMSFNTWLTDRPSLSSLNNSSYYVIASNTGSYSGSSSANISSFTCRAGIEEGTTSKVSWSCSITPSAPINYIYLRINTPNVTPFSSFGCNKGELYYDNSQVDALNQQTQIIQDQTTIINNAIENSTNTITNSLDNLTDSQNVCTEYGTDSIELDGQYLTFNGTTGNNSYYGISSYINIFGYTKVEVITALNLNQALIFYDKNKNVISSTNTTSVGELVIPNNTYYIRFSIYKPLNRPIIRVCKNGNQALDDTLNDDSVDDPTSMIEDMEDLMPENGVITNLIALPITLYTKILNSINGTCSSFSVGELYDTELIFPCIDVSDYLGSTLWGVIDVIMSAFLVLAIAKKMIKAFHNFSSMKEGDVIDD